ncbi:hypothetical protein HZS61_008317 [Fusarium oxysporum f. sp. conglutinans]|uniref:Restless-like transposase n=1 Tax=Fusarium oxysporum f. sp. conglutinans TaxID=100902 RepID=A0A8H6H2R7_FUSOX|nr:hypothetical protein HZS61_008317 [Fusarium oxysporum f. sp. conglutinans]
MIAFFRDRDPAGRSEPEGMESTSPSTNDVDVLSSSTLAVASLATPAPSLQEETPHEEVEHQYLWRCFPDYVWSQRVRDTPSWVWGFGYDVEDSSGGRRWVCRRCIQNKNPKPRSFAEKGIQNANAHLFKGHGIRAPPDKTKSAAEKKAEKLKVKDQRSIAEVMKLDTRLPREQDIANSLVKGFDRKHFQRLLLEWIIEENHAFSVCEQGRLRQIFEYLNPLVKITDANITRTTIRRKVLSAYEMHKDKVVAALKQSCGLIHVSFDGWKSGNRHSLYGIACFFRDENSQPRKLALGVPELRTRHFGHNIAAEILDVLDAYGIQDKIGYFTLDNAESNDKAMEVIGGELGFVGSRRRGRCFGHTLNLSAKALLFGHNVEAFEEQLSGEAALSEAEHTLWRRKGPVGKLHNLVVDVRRSDQLTYLLRSIQRSEFDLSSDPRIRARQPVDLIIDNDTRWLSQLYMIRRAIILRPFIEQLVLKHRQQWEQDNRSKRTGNLRKSAREPRICLEENQLTVNDWVVLEHLAKLLGFYEDAVKTLEGDGQQRKRKGGWVGSYGNVWEVIQGFEFLLEVLEDYKQLASEIPDAEHFRINVNLGWEKLNKYYSRLDETPIYYTALALHPAFRWGYFENEWKDNTEWVMKAKQMVREVWESDYRHLQVVRSPVDDEPVAKRQRKYYNPFQAYCERTRPVLGYGLVKEEATLSDDINEDTNELELWHPAGYLSILRSRDLTAQQALIDALTAKQKAMNHLREVLDTVDPTGSEMALVAMNFFIKFDLIDLDKLGNQSWRAHLEGATSIMTLLNPDSNTDASSRMLRDRVITDSFIYNILGSTLASGGLAARVARQAFQFLPVMKRVELASYLSFPPDILNIILSASELSHGVSWANQALGAADKAISLIDQALAVDIPVWADYLRQHSLVEDLDSRVHLAAAHRSAACQYILQALPVVRSMRSIDTDLLLGDVLSHLAAIDENDPYFKASSWPTFIAGAETRDPEKRTWILTRLLSIWEVCPWGYLFTAVEMLKATWAMQDTRGSENVNWLHDLRGMGFENLIV